MRYVLRKVAIYEYPRKNLKSIKHFMLLIEVEDENAALVSMHHTISAIY